MSLHHHACGCERCEKAAATPIGLVGPLLAVLAGGPISIAKRSADEPLPDTLRHGLILSGHTSALAARCGFKHADGRCYFTAPKILWLLSQVPS